MHVNLEKIKLMFTKWLFISLRDIKINCVSNFKLCRNFTT